MKTSEKTALVTGGSKGIGAAIARALAEDGFNIWLNYRSDHDAAIQLADELRGMQVECRLLPFDVADNGAVEEALEDCLQQQVPDVLVNNAGFACDGIMAMMSQQGWQSVLDVHLGGFFNVTRPVIARMLKRRRGRIINIVSTSGETGVPGQTNYSAAKAGLIGATRSLAVEVAKRNILVNAVSPGFVATEMTSDLPQDQILPLIPLGRLGQPEEVAHVVAFLASERASYITGQVLSVNGGAHT